MTSPCQPQLDEAFERIEATILPCLTMVPRATTTARAPLNHEWFKAAHSSSLIKPRSTIASPKATVNQKLPLLGIPFVNNS